MILIDNYVVDDDEASYPLHEHLQCGDQWILVPDDALLIQIIQTNTNYIFESFDDGIHYIDECSMFLLTPRQHITFRSSSQPVFTISPFGGDYFVLHRSFWDLNLPILTN